MGTFLALSGVIGKTQEDVANCIKGFNELTGGSITPKQLNFMDDNCCVIKSTGNNTSVLYPNNFLDWENASAYLSQQLQVPVFSFHIHDGDLWMYILYVNGEIEDQFNPIPDYWDDELSEDDIEAMKGDAGVVVKYVPGLHKDAIEKYLVRWNLEDEEPGKAYETDLYPREDWQLVDFMQKLNLPFPLNDDGTPGGDTYAFITKTPPIKPSVAKDQSLINAGKSRPKTTKPWWKFW